MPVASRKTPDYQENRLWNHLNFALLWKEGWVAPISCSKATTPLPSATPFWKPA
jgi:hypothetical protein